MVQTRTQSRLEAGGTPAKRASLPKKASAPKRTSGNDEVSKPSKEIPQKRKLPEDEPLKRSENPKEPPLKAPRASESSPSKTAKSSPARSANSTILKLLSSYETTPLCDLSLQEPLKPTSSTALAHIFNALLSSTRISHVIAAKTLSCIVSARYCDLPTLQKTTWEERTEILTEGGYTHYREKTATGLGDLANLVEEKYGGDAARLISSEGNEADGEQKRKAVSGRLKEIKGLGPLGAELFLETAQAVWPSLAPFIGKRDLKALREMGVEESVENIYMSLDKDSKKMSRLCAAIAKARLESKKGDFT